MFAGWFFIKLGQESIEEIFMIKKKNQIPIGLLISRNKFLEATRKHLLYYRKKVFLFTLVFP